MCQLAAGPVQTPIWMPVQSLLTRYGGFQVVKSLGLRKVRPQLAPAEKFGTRNNRVVHQAPADVTVNVVRTRDVKPRRP
jgi:hypothetical protein